MGLRARTLREGEGPLGKIDASDSSKDLRFSTSSVSSTSHAADGRQSTFAAFKGDIPRRRITARTNTGTPNMMSLKVLSSRRGATVKSTNRENGSPVREPVDTPAPDWTVSKSIVARLVAPSSTVIADSGFVKRDS